jgi:hypothetical protein
LSIIAAIVVADKALPFEESPAGITTITTFSGIENRYIKGEGILGKEQKG